MLVAAILPKGTIGVIMERDSRKNCGSCPAIWYYTDSTHSKTFVSARKEGKSGTAASSY